MHIKIRFLSTTTIGISSSTIPDSVMNGSVYVLGGLLGGVLGYGARWRTWWRAWGRTFTVAGY